jgi:vacuolar-type H+-ATPase subunit E/Vma4
MQRQTRASAKASGVVLPEVQDQVANAERLAKARKLGPALRVAKQEGDTAAPAPVTAGTMQVPIQDSQQHDNSVSRAVTGLLVSQGELRAVTGAATVESSTTPLATGVLDMSVVSTGPAGVLQFGTKAPEVATTQGAASVPQLEQNERGDDLQPSGAANRPSSSASTVTHWCSNFTVDVPDTIEDRRRGAFLASAISHLKTTAQFSARDLLMGDYGVAGGPTPIQTTLAAYFHVAAAFWDGLTAMGATHWGVSQPVLTPPSVEIALDLFKREQRLAVAAQVSALFAVGVGEGVKKALGLANQGLAGLHQVQADHAALAQRLAQAEQTLATDGLLARGGGEEGKHALSLANQNLAGLQQTQNAQQALCQRLAHAEQLLAQGGGQEPQANALAMVAVREEVAALARRMAGDDEFFVQATADNTAIAATLNGQRKVLQLHEQAIEVVRNGLDDTNRDISAAFAAQRQAAAAEFSALHEHLPTLIHNTLLQQRLDPQDEVIEAVQMLKEQLGAVHEQLEGGGLTEGLQVAVQELVSAAVLAAVGRGGSVVAEEVLSQVQPALGCMVAHWCGEEVAELVAQVKELQLDTEAIWGRIQVMEDQAGASAAQVLENTSALAALTARMNVQESASYPRQPQPDVTPPAPPAPITTFKHRLSCTDSQCRCPLRGGADSISTGSMASLADYTRRAQRPLSQPDSPTASENTILTKQLESHDCFGAPRSASAFHPAPLHIPLADINRHEMKAQQLQGARTLFAHPQLLAPAIVASTTTTAAGPAARPVTRTLTGTLRPRQAAGEGEGGSSGH